MKFYLGTHLVKWLEFAPFPLFVSIRQLRARRTMPRAACRWALDSGGFTELSMFGHWQGTNKEYASEVARCNEEIGGLDFAASRDFMCEPLILKKTGLNVRRHQELTIRNFIDLKTLRPDLPFTPVLQGWEIGDYHRHVQMYDDAGINLAEYVVGVGSVCRRQNTDEIHNLFASLAPYELKLHGFGLKLGGLQFTKQFLYSSDSMSWSYQARFDPPLEGHSIVHKNCANCFDYAALWLNKVNRILAKPTQMTTTQFKFLQSFGARVKKEKTVVV